MSFINIVLISIYFQDFLAVVGLELKVILARQVLYHFSHSTNPLFIVLIAFSLVYCFYFMEPEALFVNQHAIVFLQTFCASKSSYMF
jgi:hypothetical protein